MLYILKKNTISYFYYKIINQHDESKQIFTLCDMEFNLKSTGTI